MGLLGRMLGIKKTTPEQITRLSELRDSLMGAPANKESIESYKSRFEAYKQAVSEAGRKEAREYELMIPVFAGLLQRAQEKAGKKQSVKML